MKTIVNVAITVHCKEFDAGLIIQQITEGLGDVVGQVISVTAITAPLLDTPDTVVGN